MIIGRGKVLKWKKRMIGFFHPGEKGLILIMPRKAEHRFRLYDSWGINEAILKELATTPAITGMRIIVDEGKKVLMTTPSNWLIRGIPHRCKGVEPQIQLRERDFDRVYG